MFSQINHATGEYELSLQNRTPEERRVIELCLGLVSVSGPMELSTGEHPYPVLTGRLDSTVSPGVPEGLIAAELELINERRAKEAVEAHARRQEHVPGAVGELVLRRAS